MSNNQQKYKKSKVLNGILGGILALVIAGGVAAVGVFSNGFKDWNKFKKDDTKQEQPMTPPEDSGGSDITAEASNGIRLMSMKLAPVQYAAYGVAANAESAYTLTATVYPEDAANKLLDWTVSFKNASSTWASGKKVTDYVTVTPSSDGALTAVVQNIAAFGEQVVVKVTSRDNTSAYATLNVEYLQRTTGYTLSLDGNTKPSAFSVEKDLTAAFVENYDGKGLNISADGEFAFKYSGKTIAEILSAVYGGKTVTVDNYELSKYPYIAIKIVSPDGKQTLTIPVLLYIAVDGVTLNPNEVIF